jgi:ABC-2 type transport system permease protein
MDRVRPSYWRVFLLFARNCLVRDMSFRANFIINVVTELAWVSASIVFTVIIYNNTPQINGWNEYQYFAFIATSMLINGLVETFFMPNCAELSELVRTGQLDFALLKPIDTQFLVSLEKLDLSALTKMAVGVVLLGYSLHVLGQPVGLVKAVLYVLTLFVGVAIFYSLMIILASASVWMGRNQGLYDFWFYVTVFARYPREIYQGNGLGDALRVVFTYILPVLVVVNVPAQIVAQVFSPVLTLFGAGVAVVSLVAARRVFQSALRSYRSASS